MYIGIAKTKLSSANGILAKYSIRPFYSTVGIYLFFGMRCPTSDLIRKVCRDDDRMEMMKSARKGKEEIYDELENSVSCVAFLFVSRLSLSFLHAVKINNENKGAYFR